MTPIGEAEISLDSVVILFQDGLASESIHFQYPALALEEIYGGIT